MMKDDEGNVKLNIGRVVAKRWKVEGKLGSGGCGSVYLVKDECGENVGALKAEFSDLNTLLKMEVEVLKQVKNHPNFPMLLDYGKLPKFEFVVMELLGTDLDTLLKKFKTFTISSQTRIGVQTLYAIKQLHDLGYLHRDVKPGNFSVGLSAKMRTVFMLDFGLCRKFAKLIDGVMVQKPSRERVGFRGTSLYASAHAHANQEQHRIDDLWGWTYTIMALRGKLPWNSCLDDFEIIKMKQFTTPEKLALNSDPEFSNIPKYLADFSRGKDLTIAPDYAKIFDTLKFIIQKLNINFSDKYDWETEVLNENGCEDNCIEFYSAKLQQHNI